MNFKLGLAKAFLFLGVLILTLGFFPGAFAQSVEQPRIPRSELATETTLQLIAVYSVASFVGNVELPEIAPETKYSLKLEIHNPFTSDITFDRVQSSTGSARFQVSEGIIPAGDSAVVDVEFETPKSSGQRSVCV